MTSVPRRYSSVLMNPQLTPQEYHPTSEEDLFYDFNWDQSYRYLDVDLAPYAHDLSGRFVAWIILTALIEGILLSWPITATVLWGWKWAALTWINFCYAVRILALILSIVEVGSRVHKVAGRPVTKRRNPYGCCTLTLGAAFVSSPSLMVWYLLTLVQALIMALVFLLTLVAAPVFTSHSQGLLLGLTLGLNFLSIVESLIWPAILYAFAIRSPLRHAVFTARGVRHVQPPSSEEG